MCMLAVVMHKVDEWTTHIPHFVVNVPPNGCHPPFHDVAKVLIVDIVVGSANDALLPLLKLVLAITSGASDERRAFKGWMCGWKKRLHLNEFIIDQYSHDFCQLLELQAHSSREIVILEAKTDTFEALPSLKTAALCYSHVVSRELVKCDDISRLVKCT